MNWRGRPLVLHEVIINSIANTKTTTGLRIKAELDIDSYPLGVKVIDEQLRQVNIDRADFHGQWNYTIPPRTSHNDKLISLQVLSTSCNACAGHVPD